jgi:uncharacterized protein (TIGR03437 family)
MRVDRVPAVKKISITMNLTDEISMISEVFWDKIRGAPKVSGVNYVGKSLKMVYHLGRSVSSVLITFALVAASAWARSGGPPIGFTGAPGEGNCTSCHAGTVNPPNAGKVEILFPGSDATYTPGIPKRVRILLTDTAARRWGFQATSRIDGQENAQAGTYRPIDANTQNQQNTAGTFLYIGHTATGTRPATEGPVAFEFDWTPPETNVGAITFYVAGNAANSGNSNAGDRIYTFNTKVNFAAASGPKPSVTAAGVVTATNFSPTTPLSEGSFFTVFGSGMGPANGVSWDQSFVANTAPQTLAGTRVLINNRPAFIAFASATQVNAIVPAGVGAGPTSVVVQYNGVASDSANVTAAALVPGLFTFSPRSARFLAATSGDGSAFIGPADLFGSTNVGRPVRPARAGEVISLYATGLGPTNPAVVPGRIPSGLLPTTNAVSVRIGTATVTPDYAGLSSNVGLYQINVTVPALPVGEHEVVITIGGVSSTTGKAIVVGN